MHEQDIYGRPLAMPTLYEQSRAPVGGVTIGGKFYPGGKFIPKEAMDAASPEEREAVRTGDSRPKPVAPPGGIPAPPGPPKPAVAPKKSARAIQAELYNAPIEVSKGLSEHDAALERASQEYVRANYPKIRDLYLNGDAERDLPANGTYGPDGKLKSVTMNTDEWRALIPGYVGTNAGAVHEAASWLNKMMYAEALEDQRGKGNGRLMVLAGGGGSGKGTATGDFFVQSDYPLVLDQVSDNLKKLEAKLDEAKANGFEPEYVFIDRPPADAAGGIVGRAINLSKKGKLPRTVNLDMGLHANIAARKTAVELLKKRPDVMPSIVDNTGRGKRKLITDRDEAIRYLEGRIREDEHELNSGLSQRLKADVIARHHAGEIPREMVAGFLGPNWEQDNPAHAPDRGSAGHHSRINGTNAWR